MTRLTQNLFAAFAAVMIIAGSFCAIVTVPPAQAQSSFAFLALA